MGMPSPKELKKIAKACRDAGIKHYKDANFEFTLSEDAPVKTRRGKQVQEAPITQADAKFQSDSLSEDELLFWSATPGGNPFDKEDQAESIK